MTLPDSDTLANYGGALADGLGYAVFDYTTDRSAAHMNEALCSCAMMTRLAVRAWATFRLDTVIRHDSNWGKAAADIPVIANPSTGVYTVTWPTTVVDELGASHTLAIRAAKAAVQSSAFLSVQSEPTTANSVTIRVFNSAGTLTPAYTEDDDSIVAAFATDTGQDTFFGPWTITPTQRVIVTTNASAGTYNIVDPFVVEGIGPDGPQTDYVYLTSVNGPQVIESARFFSSITSVFVPAQNDLLGTMKVGTRDYVPLAVRIY